MLYMVTTYKPRNSHTDMDQLDYYSSHPEPNSTGSSFAYTRRVSMDIRYKPTQLLSGWMMEAYFLLGPIDLLVLI